LKDVLEWYFRQRPGFLLLMVSCMRASPDRLSLARKCSEIEVATIDLRSGDD
jgi:hypothetical protein